MWKKLLNISGVIGGASIAVLSIWGVFKYTTSQQNTTKTLTEDVIPKLNYLIKADSASKARDAVILCRVDSNKVVVDKLATQRVRVIMDDSSLSREEFIEHMDGLYQYIEDIKKNDQRLYLEPTASTKSNYGSTIEQENMIYKSPL